MVDIFYQLGRDVEKLSQGLGRAMGKIDDLNAKVDALQATVDAAQASVQVAIDDLQRQINEGASPTQLQGVIDKLEVVKQDLESTSLTPTPEPVEDITNPEETNF